MAADHMNPEILHQLLPKKAEKREVPLLKAGESQPREIRYEKIEDLEGLKACLRLRYEVYRYVNFIVENKDRMDIDPYDYYSIYLGAYDVTGGNKELVGSLRIISGDEISKTAFLIEELIKTAADPNIRSISKRPECFPIMESFQLPDYCLGRFQKSGSHGNTVHPYEISRLAIRPDYWLHGIDTGLHYLLIMDSWLHKPPRKSFMIAVHPRAQRRYEQLGMKIIPDTGQVIYKRFGQLAVAMITDIETLLDNPRRYREICDSLFGGFKKDKSFTLMAEKHPFFNHVNDGKD